MLLAGGAAQRFAGAPKGLARIQGMRIADAVLAALAEASDRQLVVANADESSEWFPGLEVVRDPEPGHGPLAGLLTALRAADGSPVLVVAWDMPFVSAPMLRAMRRRGEIAEASVVPVHGPLPLAEPLCAYYRPEAVAVAEALLHRGERRARALYEALVESGEVVTLGDRGLERFGESAHLFTSIDTREQLARLGGELPPERGTR